MNRIKGIVFILLGLFLGVGYTAYGAITSIASTQAPDQLVAYTFFTATTTTATSTDVGNGGGIFTTKGAKKVSVAFSRGGATNPNTGSTLYKIQVTPDGSTWFDFGRLIQATSTTYQPTASITAATSTLVYGLDLQYDAIYGIRCIAVETTDGEHTCKAYAEF